MSLKAATILMGLSLVGFMLGDFLFPATMGFEKKMFMAICSVGTLVGAYEIFTK